MQKIFMILRGNTNNAPTYNTRNVVQYVYKHPCKQAMYNVMHTKGRGCSSCRG
jgi:hypothetical protein